MVDATSPPKTADDAADLFGLAGRAVLIVGGGAGIGERSAHLFATVGARVGIADRDAEAARGVAEAVRCRGRDAWSFTCDILEEGAAAKMIERAERAMGGVDALVTIVGSARWASLLDMSWTDWDLDHRINLRAIFDVARETARAMIARGDGGTIAITGSISGLGSAPNHAAYGSAKAGLAALVRSMAVEWAEYGIRVNSIAPGSIATPRLPDTPERIAEFRAGKVPIKRRGHSEEVARGLLYLSSSLSSYVTGQTILVDGGQSAANVRFGPGQKI